MSFYRINSKVIYLRYRVIRKVIWSIKYISEESYKSNIMMLIDITNNYIKKVYKHYVCLCELNYYYTDLCIGEMYERIKLERCFNDMYKRLKLGNSTK